MHRSIAQNYKIVLTRPSAGQEIRLADIEADADVGMGAFETLSGHKTVGTGPSSRRRLPWLGGDRTGATSLEIREQRISWFIPAQFENSSSTLAA